MYAKILTDRWLQVVCLLVLIIFASKFHIYLKHPSKYFLIAKVLLDFFREVPFAALHRSRHTPRPRLTPSWGNLPAAAGVVGIRGGAWTGTFRPRIFNTKANVGQMWMKWAKICRAGWPAKSRPAPASQV